MSSSACPSSVWGVLRVCAFSIRLQPTGFNWLSLSNTQWESHCGAPGSPLLPGTVLTWADKQNFHQLNNKVQIIWHVNSSENVVQDRAHSLPLQQKFLTCMVRSGFLADQSILRTSICEQQVGSQTLMSFHQQAVSRHCKRKIRVNNGVY